MFYLKPETPPILTKDGEDTQISILEHQKKRGCEEGRYRMIELRVPDSKFGSNYSMEADQYLKIIELS